MKNFNDIYEEIYKKCAQPMEQMRKTTRNGFVIVFTISIFLGILLTVLTSYSIFLVIAIVIMVLYIILSKNNKKYRQFFKQNVVKTFIKEYSQTLEYIPERGISPRIYANGEFESYDRYYSEDLITGELNDKYKIAMAQVHTEQESRDSDGDTTYTTVFYGLFAEIQFEKLVATNMKIRKNKMISFNKKEKIEMDSGEFEKKFDVYSIDKIIAMQLLTSDIMQMLIDFSKENKLIPEMTLKGNTLYIRFATGNMFEPKILKKSLDYDTLKKYYDTINFTLGITEKFLKNIEETQI